MCKVASVVVIPRTAEVLHVEGTWSHSAICAEKGVEYDQVFKPEVLLVDRRLRFDTPEMKLAFKRSLSAEKLQLVQQTLLVQGLATLEELETWEIIQREAWEWEPRHETAVAAWVRKYIGDWRRLLAFSEHTFELQEYRKTLSHTTAARSVYDTLPTTPREHLLVKRAWQIIFEKPENRAQVWR